MGLGVSVSGVGEVFCDWRMGTGAPFGLRAGVNCVRSRNVQSFRDCRTEIYS
jgi:hypothetical protein